MESVLAASLLLRPSAGRCCWLGLSRHRPWRHPPILWTALAWSLAFGIWSTTWEAHSGVTPLLINSNLDLNAYIRRFAGSLTENLHFDGVEACIYTSGSSKKLSSLLLALTVAPFPNPVQGITAFQGALAGAVLLAVFHIGFHVSAVTNLGTWPVGIGFARTITLPQDPDVPIVIFSCEKDSIVPLNRQYHERLVGLDLALRHPERDILELIAVKRRLFTPKLPPNTSMLPVPSPVFLKLLRGPFAKLFTPLLESVCRGAISLIVVMHGEERAYDFLMELSRPIEPLPSWEPGEFGPPIPPFPPQCDEPF